MNAKNTVLSKGQMSESSDKNYLSDPKKSNSKTKGKESMKKRLPSVSRAISNGISVGLSSAEDDDRNLISIGGSAGNFDERHHPSAIKKSFQQFRRDAFAGMGGIRNRKLKQRKPQDDLPVIKSEYDGGSWDERI